MKTFAYTLTVTLTLALSCAATTVNPMIALDKRVEIADHIFIGKVVRIRAVDDQGNDVTNTTVNVAGKKVFVRVTVEPEEIISSPLKTFPKLIEVDENYHWGDPHDAPEMIAFESNRLLAKKWIFLLKGDRFESVYTGYFVAPLEQKEDVVKLIKEKQAAKISAQPKPDGDGKPAP